MPSFSTQTYLCLLAASSLVLAGPLSNQRRAVPKGWTALGCMADPPAQRTLNAVSTAGDDMSIEFCTSFCSARNYTYSGVEFGRECYCDYFLQNAGDLSVADDECNIPCAGNAAEICGAGGLLNVFWNGAPPPTPPAPVGAFVYAGCYTDEAPPRTLNERLDIPGGVDAATCVAACSAAGYTIAGTEIGRECWCGDKINPLAVKVGNNECTMTCEANRSEFCGASFRLTVLSSVPIAPGSTTGGAATGTPVPTATVTGTSAPIVPTTLKPTTTAPVTTPATTPATTPVTTTPKPTTTAPATTAVTTPATTPATTTPKPTTTAPATTAVTTPATTPVTTTPKPTTTAPATTVTKPATTTAVVTPN